MEKKGLCQQLLSCLLTLPPAPEQPGYAGQRNDGPQDDRQGAAARRQWKDGYFVVPGLRLNGGPNGDQKRVVTPRQARDDGASVLVVGRPISRADEPVAAARAIEATL